MKLSNLVPTSTVAKCYVVLVAVLLMSGFVSMTALGSTEYEPGEDRYALLNGDLDDTDGNWSINAQLNVSIPEEMGTRHTIDGTITYNMTQGDGSNLSDVSPAFYGNITVDVQGETVHSNYTFDFSENDTEYEKDVDIDLGDGSLNESGDTNDTMTVTFETESNTTDSGSDVSTSDSWTGEVELTEQITYMVDELIELFSSAIIPLVVVVWVLIFIFNLLGGIFKDFNI